MKISKIGGRPTLSNFETAKVESGLAGFAHSNSSLQKSANQIGDSSDLKWKIHVPLLQLKKKLKMFSVKIPCFWSPSQNVSHPAAINEVAKMKVYRQPSQPTKGPVTKAPGT